MGVGGARDADLEGPGSHPRLAPFLGRQDLRQTSKLPESVGIHPDL